MERRRSRRWIWVAMAVLAGLLLVGIPLWRGTSSLDEPRPVEDAGYQPTGLEALLIRLGVRQDPPLYLDAGQMQAIQTCVDQTRSVRSTFNGVSQFRVDSVRDTLFTCQKQLTDPFYSAFLLSKWHESAGNDEEARRWMEETLNTAPVILVQGYEFADGRPLANARVGQLGIECRMRTPGQANASKELEYINLITDEKGRVYLPCYDTKIRRSSVEWPRGYEIETGTHGYLELGAKYNLLPSILVWPKGSQRPATDLPPSEFYEYRNAVGAKGLSHTVGDSRIRVDRCYRSGADGNVTVTDGRDPVELGDSAVPEFTGDNRILDQALIHVVQEGSKSYEILQVRIFDHRSRCLLNQYHAPADWRFDGEGEIRLVSLARELPEEVDVWFWVTEFEPGQTARILPATPGSKAEFNICSVELAALHAGQQGYSTTAGPNGSTSISFHGEPRETETQVQAAFKIRGKGAQADGRFARVALVTADGERLFSDRGVYPRNHTLVLDFSVPLGRIAHFEVLPIGREECFFFDSVCLPPRSGPSVDPAGSLEVDVKTNGEAGRFTVEPGAGIRVGLTVLAGRGGMSFRSGSGEGLESSRPDFSWTASGNYTGMDKYSTTVCEVSGISSRLLRIQMVDLSGNPFEGIRGSGGSGLVWYQAQAVPVEQLEGVKVRLSWSAD